MQRDNLSKLLLKLCHFVAFIMFDFLLQLDKSIFISINSLPHNFLTDSVMLFFSASSYWLVFWIFLTVLYILFYGLREKRMILSCIICAVLTFFAVSLGLQNIIGRSRPIGTVDTTIEIGPHINSGSFPSAHAAFSFGLFIILAKFHPKRGLYLFLVAFLVSFSRLYLGKHYPSDVVVGAMVGIFIGFISLKISNKIGYNLIKLSKKL